MGTVSLDLSKIINRGVLEYMGGSFPSSKQLQFLFQPEREVFYGGAAGGGKTFALLMASLQFADKPGYAALLLRRTYKDLGKPGALMDVSRQWLGPTDAKWDGINHTWRFPSGATLSFGYLESENDKYQYQGAQYQFIGFDELTQFTETQYQYLFSRLRKPVGMDIPIRMRSASNPGGVGHEWVRQRFIDSDDPERIWVPAGLDDNEHLDRGEYIQSLMNLDPVTRDQLLKGDWDATPPGSIFQRHWFKIVDAHPENVLIRIRSWDLAASLDGDWTVGVRISKGHDGFYYIEDVARGQFLPGDRDRFMRQTTEVDGKGTTVHLQQEPGSSGVDQITALVKLLAGYTVKFEKPTGDKRVRAGPYATQAQIGMVRVVRAPWNRMFLEEHQAFTGNDKETDDQVDAASFGFKYVLSATSGRPPKMPSQAKERTPFDDLMQNYRR